MFITAVEFVLFLIKLLWPKNKSLYWLTLFAEVYRIIFIDFRNKHLRTRLAQNLKHIEGALQKIVS